MTFSFKKLKNGKISFTITNYPNLTNYHINQRQFEDLIQEADEFIDVNDIYPYENCDVCEEELVRLMKGIKNE